MKAHPAAEVFPMMSDADVAALAEDIKVHGLRVPVVKIEYEHDWAILDGRNRLRACELAGVTPTFSYYRGSDPMGEVMSLNLHRRHLSESQRALIGAKAEPVYAEQAKGRQREGGRIGGEGGKVVANLPPPSDGSIGKARAQAAAAVNVSPRSVQSAKLVLTKGVPELVKAVEVGDVSIHAAVEIAKQPQAKQAESLEAKRNGVVGVRPNNSPAAIAQGKETKFLSSLEKSISSVLSLVDGVNPLDVQHMKVIRELKAILETVRTHKKGR